MPATTHHCHRRRHSHHSIQDHLGQQGLAAQMAMEVVALCRRPAEGVVRKEMEVARNTLAMTQEAVGRTRRHHLQRPLATLQA
jgi:hypothetical protein